MADKPVTYLSFKRDDSGKIVVVQSPKIDANSTFQQTGTCFALEGMAIGFNIVLFGAPTPNSQVNFQVDKPMFTPGWDTAPLTQTGRIVPVDSKGLVAIQWPL